AAALLCQLTWHEFCDWHLELSKLALESMDAAEQERTRGVLATVLDSVLRLLHPLMPFITEEIWHALHPDRTKDSIMVQSYPVFHPEAVVEGAEIHVPLAGLVNLQEENKRLEREIGKVANDLAAVQRKLGDAKFVERAPEEVVEKERERAAQLEEKRLSLEKSLERLRQI